MYPVFRRGPCRLLTLPAEGSAGGGGPGFGAYRSPFCHRVILRLYHPGLRLFPARFAAHLACRAGAERRRKNHFSISTAHKMRLLSYTRNALLIGNLALQY